MKVSRRNLLKATGLGSVALTLGWRPSFPAPLSPKSFGDVFIGEELVGQATVAPAMKMLRSVRLVNHSDTFIKPVVREDGGRPLLWAAMAPGETMDWDFERPVVVAADAVVEVPGSTYRYVPQATFAYDDESGVTSGYWTGPAPRSRDARGRFVRT